MSDKSQRIPAGSQGRHSEAQALPPRHLKKWAAMASNLAVCGACVWMVVAALFVTTDLAEFTALLVLLTAIQFLLEFSLLAILRKLRLWPQTPRLAFYRFAFAVGFLPLALSVAAVLSRWLQAL